MSACKQIFAGTTTHQPANRSQRNAVLAARRTPRIAQPPTQRLDIRHDLTLPISVTLPIIKDLTLQEVDDHFNSYVMREREIHGKRTVLKLAWEVYARKSAKNNNLQRLRNKSILINLPSADQAELVIAAVTRIVESMDGKLLVKG